MKHLKHKNKNMLLLFDGASGAGKTTLINMIKEWDNFDLMKIVTTRKARPSDGAELECVGPLKFHLQRLKRQIILPQLYNRNKKWYGIKNKSLKKTQKTNLVGHIYPDWKIINELRKKYKVIAIFLSADMNVLKERLLKRIDGHKEKKECLEYIPVQLKEYEKNKHLFDYHLENNTTLKELEGSVKKILNHLN